MKRVNEFEVRPRSEADRELLVELLDASAALWNELTFERRELFAEDESVWNTTDYRERYKGVLGSATAQQVIRKNESAWRSFFALLEDPEQEAYLPGFWGNREDGRELRTYLRNDQYTLEWGERSRLEIPVGTQLKEEYGLDYHERLRLEVAGKPTWKGEEGRLELYYDEVSETFRALQPVTVPDSRRDAPLASEVAALDVGANTLVACTTTTGEQYCYYGRDIFERFRETTERIAEYQSMLDDQRRSSRRINRIYRRRTDRRNHAQDALVRDLVERLHSDGIATIYVGELGDVLSEHWSCVVNQKTHTFWAFSRFVHRLCCVCEEYGIEVVVTSEAFTTKECPECGEREHTHRRGDVYRCGACGFEGHADLKASRVFLERETGGSVGPMARPVCLEWDNHDWRQRERASSAGGVRRRCTTDAKPRRTNPKEDDTDRSTGDGNLATVGSGTA